ncbi:MAG TPA: ABC transporter ATP-binding protein [Candidatus Saccharimonadales bacterium]|nr:ABC transporter ATP-binding protein [Candidatus Saccharimonadales bacterium]
MSTGGNGAGRPEAGAVLTCQGLSRWYGQVIGINDVSLEIGPGVTGLLGPNGAGKSTLLKLITGQLKPSRGSLTLLGQTVWDNPEVMRHLGFCPEQDAFYEFLTGFTFVSSLARMNGYSAAEARDLTLEALERVGLTEFKDKKIGGYSKGMRQKVKLAQAIVHKPRILILDEPLSGMDPLARISTIRLIREIGRAGGTVIVSSHILHEVESMTRSILMMANGRIVAEGDVHDIRDLMDEHPHRIFLETPQVRELAEALVTWEDVQGVKVDGTGLIVETVKPDVFYSRLPGLVLERGLKVESLITADDNLQAVFDYLVK